MFDINILRSKVQAFQGNRGERQRWDPVTLAERLKETPKDVSLEVAWAGYSCGMMDGVIFECEKDEPLVGRVRYAEHSDAEWNSAIDYLQNDAFFVDFHVDGQTGHCEPFYDDIFRLGIGGLRKKIQSLEASADDEKREIYRGFLIALDGFAEMVARAADCAGCEEAAERCRRLASEPPTTFRDALQLLWFVDVGIMCGESAHLVGPGRLDRRLIPYYERDLAAGRVTYESAVSDIALLYLYINDLTRAGLAYGVMVGGETVNALSYACIDAVRVSRLVYPSVGLCVNESTPRDLKALALDVISEGYPNPSFFNDRVIRKGLEYYGVPKCDSGNYINSTCVEITPCGASGVWVASPYYNLCGVLLETLGTDYADFDAFLDGYKANLAAKIRDGVANQNGWRTERNRCWRRPFQSIFTNDCLKRGMDIEQGGARYNWVECSFVGLANLVDSLTVIREEIFNQRNMTQSEMLKLLESNFEGHDSERLKFLNHYPKYGHDNAAVDGLIQPMIAFIRAECAKYRMAPDGSFYIPGTFCWEMHQRLGGQTGATPDGRTAGFPFADGAGPAQGREKFGPTTAVKSVCSWDHSMLVGGSAFNMKYSKSLLKSAEEREKLLSLIDAFIKGGGFQTQINVADNETLRKALAHPEEYSDLVVRIGGYTDYFVRLSPQMQQEVMLRTQYESV
ncbi:MAG: hypothetical protein J5833_07625 [Victivallales bacterium]|nr:hypothetical protein [Victivallales bacterium]